MTDTNTTLEVTDLLGHLGERTPLRAARTFPGSGGAEQEQE